MARKRRKAPKILLHPMFRWIRGKMGKIVYRLAHNGEVSAYPAPDMSQVIWSPAQKAQRQNFAKASAYAKLAIQDPEIRQYVCSDGEAEEAKQAASRRYGSLGLFSRQ
jgi:hypothetical protein